MVMKNIYIIFILFLGFSAHSQGENDHWYFGDKAAVNFSGTPVALTNSAMNAPEACGSVSDAQGNLLFYTDGMTIWDREHNIMSNGTGLTGTLKSAQTLIIGEIGNKDRYYVFTTADPFSKNSYTAYSVVDMTLGALGSTGQPLGDVDKVLKNVPVLDNYGKPITTSAVTAVPHANGTDYWLLIPTQHDLLSFLFDGSGISNAAVVNTLQNPNIDGVMFVKASPFVNTNAGFDTLLAIGFTMPINGSTVDFHRFDSSTGAMLYSFPYVTVIFGSSNSFSVEFSQDGSIAYCSSWMNSFPNNVIVGVDILAMYLNQVGSSYNQVILPSNIQIGQLQRAKDGEVYYTEIGSGYLGKIDNPTNTYTGFSTNPTNVFLNGAISSNGLPQLVPKHPGCITDIILMAPETNNNYTYQVSNSITTQTNYSISSLNIDMKAGNSILLLPDTEIGLGSNYTAVIENCPASKPSKMHRLMPSGGVQNYVININDMFKAVSEVKVYPNPASNIFTIDTENSDIQKWELYDLSGKKVLEGKESVGSVEGLAKAAYILKVSLKNNEVKTHKLIVK